MQGIVNKLSTSKSDELFYERARDKQAVAVLSKQSLLLDDEVELRNKVKQLINSSDEIVRPKNWHAYHLAIQSIEFWIGNKNRFHQRLRYDLKVDIGIIKAYNLKVKLYKTIAKYKKNLMILR